MGDIQYFRPDHEIGGMGSHISMLLMMLIINKPSNYSVKINMSNFRCKWEDLFYMQNNQGKQVQIIIPGGKLAFNQARYPDSYITNLHQAFKLYIRPKEDIYTRIEELCKLYPIKDSICVYYRGTDKFREVKSVSFDKYIEHIPTEGKIYVQSDEKRFIDYIKRKCGDRVYFIPEFKLNTSAKPIHMNNATIEDAKEGIYIMYLMAYSKYLVANISNMVLVALIIRGHQNNYIPIE